MTYKMTVMITLLLIFSASLQAQTGAPVSSTNFPSSTASPTMFLDYDGSNNNIYICYARSAAPNSTTPNYNFSLSVASSNLTNIVVAANVGTVTTPAAHGLMVGNKVVITGSATSALNGTYQVATVPSTTTFTIATSGVGNGTYTDMTVSGQAPLLTAPIWSIQKNTFATANKTQVQWAGGTPGTFNKICANRAVTTGANAIFYQ